MEPATEREIPLVEVRHRIGELVNAVAFGSAARVVITRNGKPIAALVPLPSQPPAEPVRKPAQRKGRV